MQRKIKTRTTEGLNARVFITANVAYSTEATYADFVNNAVDGEFGVFTLTSAMNAETEATIRTTLMTAGEEYFMAQMQIQPDLTRLTKKTPLYKFNDVNVANWAEFCLPVKQVTTVGYNGTDGDIEDVVTAVAINDNFDLSVMETTEGYQPYPTWGYSYTAISGDVLSDVVSALVAQINNDQSAQNKENEPLVIAEMIVAGTATIIPSSLTLAVVNGSASVTFSGTGHGVVAGDLLRIGGAGAAVYKVASSDATAVVVLDSVYVGTTDAAVANASLHEMTVLTAQGIQLTAKETGDTFHVALKEELADVQNRVLTSFKDGSGYVEHIANLEYEGKIFDGTTTVNAAFSADFGEQNTYRVATTGYDVIHIGHMANVASKAMPNSNDTQESHVMIAGATPDGTIALPYVDVASPADANKVIEVLKTIFAV